MNIKEKIRFFTEQKVTEINIIIKRPKKAWSHFLGFITLQFSYKYIFTQLFQRHPPANCLQKNLRMLTVKNPEKKN